MTQPEIGFANELQYLFLGGHPHIHKFGSCVGHFALPPVPSTISIINPQIYGYPNLPSSLVPFAHPDFLFTSHQLIATGS